MRGGNLRSTRDARLRFFPIYSRKGSPRLVYPSVSANFIGQCLLIRTLVSPMHLHLYDLCAPYKIFCALLVYKCVFWCSCAPLPSCFCPLYLSYSVYAQDVPYVSCVVQPSYISIAPYVLCEPCCFLSSTHYMVCMRHMIFECPLVFQNARFLLIFDFHVSYALIGFVSSVSFALLTLSIFHALCTLHVSCFDI